ncbi:MULTISPECIES: DUF6571 family protein [unclassified Streptomyces]|uniref:DUF6571 family protein n=1 Tax=unclassified Streptomyces TaxID=2593676 RepID=UPI0022B70C70|nr:MULTISPECIES: DUF6571 family protein [unclassified Streptomyces]MCZ7414886.1 hypothetical protein [Streptomyces sp. WMMC897]MCZ7431829.1 hypothetical protein [Streptomyces sp. WMMC1477]
MSADLTPLDEAVVRWRSLPGRFNTVSRDFDSQVIKGLRGSDWRGETAEAAFTKFDAVVRQFLSAEDEARAIHRLLESALEAFRSAQKRARAVRTEVEEDRNLSISSEGVVTFSATDDEDGSRQRLYVETITGYNTRIRSAVNDATDADEALKWALTQDRNGRDQGFNAGMYASVDAAAEGRRQAAEDADTTTRILAKGHGADYADLRTLNRVLARREGDPYFAERFALKAGPNGVLEFWAGVTADHDRTKKQTAILTRLQDSLGHTLATASHSQSPEMRQWKKEIIELGGERVVAPTNPGAEPVKARTPYGFQVLSSLLHEGDFDPDFLQTYGRELIDFEKKGGSRYIWTLGVEPHYLNIGGTDKGNDPMAGFLTALGNNPEASKGFFKSGNWDNYDPGEWDKYLDKDLKYLLLERDWPHDPVEGEDSRRGFAYDELGRALESATLGVPYREVGLQRDDVTANVMEQVAIAVAHDPDFSGKRPGVLNSLAEMGAGYIDDLSWGVAPYAGPMDAEDHRNMFDREGGGHISLGEDAARRFLFSVGQHPGGYETLSAAQHAYTATLMEAQGDDVRMASKAQNVGAYNHGILDEARTSQIEEGFKGKADEVNRAREESASWKKYGVSVGVSGAAFLGVAAATANPAAGVAAAVAVPVAVDAGAKAFDTYFGNEMSEDLKAGEKNNLIEAGLESEKIISHGQRMSWSNGYAYQELHGVKDLAMDGGAASAYMRGMQITDSADGD